MNKMDKIIHDKLYNYSVPVAEDLWDRFEEKAFADKKTRRKPLFWVFPFLILLILLGWGLTSILLPKQIQPSGPQLQSIASPVISKVDQNIGILEDTLEMVRKNPAFKKESIKQIVEGNTKTKNFNHPSEKLKPVQSSSTGRIGLNIKNSFQSLSSRSLDPQENNWMKSSSLGLGVRGFQPKLEDFSTILLLKPGELNSSLPAFNLPKRAECPKFSPIPPKIYLEAYFSPDYTHKYLESRSSDIMDKYKDERLDSEYPVISYSAGFRVSWMSGLAYGIKSGLEFAQINEQFDYTDPNSTISKTFITIDTIFHPNGSIEVYTDTSTITIKGETLYSIYNRFTSLNIPVLLSYEWNFDHFFIALTAGVEMNLLFAQKGQMLDENLYAQEFTTGNINSYRPFKDNLSLSYVANIGLYYPINKNLDAIIEPHFKIDGSSITKNSYPLTQKFATGGLRLGLRYRIGKKN